MCSIGHAFDALIWGSTMIRLVAADSIALVCVAPGRVEALEVTAANAGVLAQDGQGNFIVGISPPSAVLELQAGSGLELWRYDVGPLGGLLRILVAANDDVIVGGVFDGEPIVVRLDGATGTELWRSTPPAGLQGGNVHALALTSAGDVVASMFVDRGQNGIFIDMDVFRLSGATGEEIWSRQLDGTSSSPIVANYGSSVAVDGDDDVFVAGSVFDGESQRLFVSKLLHEDGSVAWFRRIVGDGSAVVSNPFTVSQDALAVGNEGAIAVVGVVFNGGDGPAFRDLAVAKLDPDTGNDLWQHQIDGGAMESDSAFDVAIDEQGGVIATGRLWPRHRRAAMVTLKFAADGTPLWTRRKRDFGYSTFGILPTGESYACGQMVKRSGKSRSFLQKLRSDGRTGWRRRTRDGRCRDIIPQPNGDVIAVGIFRGVESVLRFSSDRGKTSEP